jgi:1-phosphatidylinositol-4-phosphate 5-kinase
MIKLLRWRRKRSKIKKALKSYVKGKVIDGEHELYTLSIAVMIGVRTSISKTNTIINAGGPKKRWVLQEDFRATEKYEFRPKGGSKTPPHQLAHTFKFKDYSPIAFAYLRRLYGVNEFDFLLSICGNANFIEFISNAKSGQFFFYSSDGKYMIKTMTNAESKFLRRSKLSRWRALLCTSDHLCDCGSLCIPFSSSF